MTRWALRAGVVGSGLLAVGLMLIGLAPEIGASPDRVSSYMAPRRGQLLAAALLLGVAATLLAWFATGASSRLQRGRSGVGTAVVTTAGVALTGVLVASALWATAVVLAGHPARAGEAATLLDAARVVLVIGLVPAAVAIYLLGTLLRESDVRAPGVTTTAPVLAAMALATVPLAFIERGPLAPGILFPFVAGLLIAVWAAGLGISLLRHVPAGIVIEIARGRRVDSARPSR
jgi:hypothetical protein